MKTYPMVSFQGQYIKDVRLPLRFRMSTFNHCRFISHNENGQSCVQLRDERIAWISDDSLNQLTKAGIKIGGRK